MRPADMTLRQFRAGCIHNLERALDSVTKVEAPRWLVLTLLVPVFLFELLKLAFKCAIYSLWCVVASLMALVISPFIGLYQFIDISLIMYWFFKQIANRMTGKENK